MERKKLVINDTSIQVEELQAENQKLKQQLNQYSQKIETAHDKNRSLTKKLDVLQHKDAQTYLDSAKQAFHSGQSVSAILNLEAALEMDEACLQYGAPWFDASDVDVMIWREHPNSKFRDLREMIKQGIRDTDMDGRFCFVSFEEAYVSSPIRITACKSFGHDNHTICQFLERKNIFYVAMLLRCEKVCQYVIATHPHILQELPDALSTAAGNGLLMVVEFLSSLESYESLAVIRRFLANRNLALIAASWSGYIEIVKCLLAINVDVNHCDSNGRTALSYAAEKGYFDVVRCLLEHKDVDVNSSDYREVSVLAYATINGDLEMVKYLVDTKKANVNQGNSITGGPIFYAARKDHSQIVRFLVENSARLDQRIMYGMTVLHVAVESGCLSVTRYLIEDRHMDTSLFTVLGQNILHIASECGHLEVVEYLLNEVKMDVNLLTQKTVVETFFSAEKGKNILHLAAKSGHLEVVKYLVDEVGMDIDNYSNSTFGRSTALTFAADAGHEVVVGFLLYRNPKIPVNWFGIAVNRDALDLIEKVKKDNPYERRHFASVLGFYMNMFGEARRREGGSHSDSEQIDNSLGGKNGTQNISHS